MDSKPDNSEIRHHSGGGVTITGKDGMNFYRAVTLKSMIGLHQKTGLIPTRGVSITRMFAMATEYTGKHYKRGGHDEAIADLSVWIETMRAALPITKEGESK
jgi:hypothetical protein